MCHQILFASNHNTGFPANPETPRILEKGFNFFFFFFFFFFWGGGGGAWFEYCSFLVTCSSKKKPPVQIERFVSDHKIYYTYSNSPCSNRKLLWTNTIILFICLIQSMGLIEFVCKPFKNPGKGLGCQPSKELNTLLMTIRCPASQRWLPCLSKSSIPGCWYYRQCLFCVHPWCKTVHHLFSLSPPAFLPAFS